jgi:hypothetical protein
MCKFIILLGSTAALTACGQSADNSAANASANAAPAQKPRPAYCFFKESDTKGWKASVDKNGNVVVTGKAYDEDRRYKGALGPATVSGATAEIAPTIAPNDTGFGSADNWWDVKATIPNSQAVTSVTVTCGEKTLTTLDVPRKG